MQIAGRGIIRQIYKLTWRLESSKLTKAYSAAPIRFTAALTTFTKGIQQRSLIQSAARKGRPMVQSPSQASCSYILGIESSCDDTAVAVLRTSDGAVLGHSIANQVDIHAPWGGVVPNLAQEAHRAAIDRTVQDALDQASLRLEQIEAVAVTIGPGLSLCLKVGVLKAMELAHAHRMKFLPVHHMEAHALVARQATDVSFPFLCLLISGGHNMLIIAHGVGEYTLLGSTLDDALGEAYDKVARLLGLEARPNGGSALEKLALQGDEGSVKFSLPLKKFKDCNFSYAGTKTAVRLAIESKLPEGPTEENVKVRADIAASFQKVAVDHLAARCRRAAEWAKEDLPDLKHLVVAGGVAANKRVRASLGKIAEVAGLELVCPAPSLCTDNGIMVAWAGLERCASLGSLLRGLTSSRMKIYDLCRLRLGLEEEVPPLPEAEQAHLIDVRPRWPLTNRMDRRLRVSDRGQRKARIFPSLTELSMAKTPVLQGH